MFLYYSTTIPIMKRVRRPTRFNETSVSLAVPVSASLRTTILAFVHDKLGLKGGDQISWSYESKKNRVRIECGAGEFISKVVEVGGSLRTTVPQEVVQILQIRKKDILVWDIDKECDKGNWFAIVMKKKG